MPETLPSVDQMTDIFDIKPGLPVDLFWVWVGLGIFVVCLLALILLLVLKSRRKPVEIIPIQTLAPREQALKDLSDLDRLSLLEHGQFRKYYFRLSEIFRYFLEGGFLLPAIDTTTEELRPHLAVSDKLNKEYVKIIENILTEMDLVKFAKFIPSLNEIQNLRYRIQDFVSTAKIVSSTPSSIPQEQRS